MTYNNHLSIGSTAIQHKDKTIYTSLNSISFESFLEQMDSFAFDIGTVPAGYEHRADLISNVFYGTPTYDWVICWFNNISDPLQRLRVGDDIRIPRLINV